MFCFLFCGVKGSELDIPARAPHKPGMRFLRAALLAFVMLACGVALAQRGDEDWLYRGSDIARDTAWRFGTLANGLHYAVRRNALPAGQVSIRIRIDAGSLHEREDERGFAHFIEHMLFRGTEHYPDRRAREIWARLGASFGSDSNASTDAANTLYMLNLPHATREPLDTSLAVLADMMMAARIDPDAVTGERQVVLAEKGRRPELSQRQLQLSQRLIYAGLLIARRDTIGADETLNAATADGLGAFYRRWYRPERATIIMVGDADPDMMEELIRARFGGWQAQGPAPAEPDYGRIAEPALPVAELVYPGTPTQVTLAWVRPYETLPHTMARERLFLEETLAGQIVNRRLEAHARGTSAFNGAFLFSTRARGIANVTYVALSTRDGNWRRALAEVYAILGDAMLSPPSQAEIDRELLNMRTNVTSALQSETTMRSQAHADMMIGAVASGSVVASARTTLDNFERNAREMNPERIGGAIRALFDGSGPRMMLLTPTPIEGGEAALAQGLAEARAATPASRVAQRQVSFDDLPRPGRPGREISRQRIEDMDVTIVRFANGSTLTFKHTDYERGSVSVRLRFGGGLTSIAPNRRSYAWLSGLVAGSGIARLDLSGMERLLTGRRMGLAFGIQQDAFVLSGETSAADLDDQLRLLTAKLIRPRWDADLFARFRSAAVDTFDLHLSSAAARARRETNGFLHPGDERFRPIERNEMAAATVGRFRDFYAPLLAAGPVHAIIVGDIGLDDAVEAVRRTAAALPNRREPAIPTAWTQLRPPAPAPEPRTFTHQGDPNQAYALIGWSTLGGADHIGERRALALAANIFEIRLFDRLREEEGVTYAPDAVHLASDTFPAWGVFYASAELRPSRAAAFFRIAREIIADLAARPVSAEEFERALNPVLSGIERRLASNAYWVDALENWERSARDIENVRTYLADYRALTPEAVRAAVAAYVTDQGDWSMLVLPARGGPAREANGNQ